MKRSSGPLSYGGLGWPDRRRARPTPRARLWPGSRGLYPALSPAAWYALYTPAPRDPVNVWVRTVHGLTRVRRADVEIRAEAS